MQFDGNWCKTFCQQQQCTNYKLWGQFVFRFFPTSPDLPAAAALENLEVDHRSSRMVEFSPPDFLPNAAMLLLEYKLRNLPRFLVTEEDGLRLLALVSISLENVLQGES
jgi:hypothetical protein